MNYIIADQPITLTDTLVDQTAFARALAPFAVDRPVEPQLRLVPVEKIDLGSLNYREATMFDFPDANADCHFGRGTNSYIFYMESRIDGRQAIFLKDDASVDVLTDLTPKDPDAAAMLRFGLWMMFGVAVNARHRVAVHSSVIRWRGGAVMFLGESGTGKSTHTRLWRQHIPEAQLLNDDSPIVGMHDGVPTVFGSPWSGKTPCYKNESYPIRAIVRLSQAPHNRIRRLPVISAIGALLPSCPPAFAFDNALQDNICDTLSEVLTHVPAYHLECLPDAGAAQLAFETLFGGEQ